VLSVRIGLSLCTIWISRRKTSLCDYLCTNLCYGLGKFVTVCANQCREACVTRISSDHNVFMNK
jgi:hypothetical protein